MRHNDKEFQPAETLSIEERKKQLFPKRGERAVLRQSDKLGDCYLLASLDYFFGCEEGRDFIENLFTATDKGIVVRLKHTELSKYLEKHTEALSNKYSYYHDAATNEDVFLVKYDYLRQIQEHTVGVSTETPAIQILEHLIPYYYKGAEKEHMDLQLDSVTAHGRAIERTSTDQKQTEFLAKILGTTTDESMTVDEAIKLKKIAPDFPFYLSMKYHDTNNRHAYVFDRLDEYNGLLLRNPHNNKVLERLGPSYIQERSPRFVHYKINPGQFLVLKQLIKIPLGEALEIKNNDELFSFLTTVATQLGHLEQGEFKLVLKLYQRYQSRLLSYFRDLDPRSKNVFISGFGSTDVKAWINHIQQNAVSFRQLQRIELVHQLIESKLLETPENAEFNHEHLTSANQKLLIEAVKKLKPSPNFSEKKVQELKEKFGDYLAADDPLVQEITKKSMLIVPSSPRILIKEAEIIHPSTPKDKFSYYLEDNDRVKEMDCFKIMQITEDDLSQLKKKYKALMLEFHPDKNQSSERSKICTQLITHAFEVLSDPSKLAAYKAERSTSFFYKEDFNYTNLRQYFDEKISKINQLTLRFERLQHLGTADGSEDSLEKIIRDLEEVWSALVSQDLAKNQYDLYFKIKEKVRTGKEFYALYLITRRENLFEMRQRILAIDVDDLASAALNYHPLAMAIVIDKALSGHYKNLEGSIKWALKALHYLETVAIPNLEKDNSEETLLKEVKETLECMREKQKEVLPLIIPTDPDNFNTLTSKVLAYRKTRGGASEEIFSLLDEKMFSDRFVAEAQLDPINPIHQLAMPPETPPLPIKKRNKENRVRFADQQASFTSIQTQALEDVMKELGDCLDILNDAQEKELSRWCTSLHKTVKEFQENKNFGAFKREIEGQLNSDNFRSFAEPDSLGQKIYNAVVSLLNAFIHWFDFQRPRPDFFSKYQSNRSIQLKRKFDVALNAFDNITSPSNHNPPRS